MSLALKINQDFLTAFKNKQATVVSVLRMLKAALTNKEIEKKMPKGQNLPDEEVVAVIKSEIKKRKDSIEAYGAGQRADLIEKEEAELKILEKYLPEQMSEEEIKKIVLETISEIKPAGPADFGKVMGQVVKKTKNQADGQIVSRIVKEELNK